MCLQGRIGTVERDLGTACAQISNLSLGGLSLPQIQQRVEQKAAATVEEIATAVVERKMAAAMDAKLDQTVRLLTTLNGALAKRVAKLEGDLLDASMHEWVLLILFML